MADKTRQLVERLDARRFKFVFFSGIPGVWARAAPTWGQLRRWIRANRHYRHASPRSRRDQRRRP